MIFDKYENIIDRTEPMKHEGRVKRVVGLIIEGTGPNASLGELCLIELLDQKRIVRSEVVAFGAETVYLMAYDDITGLKPGSRIKATGSSLQLYLSDLVLGRVLNGLGEPIDEGPALTGDQGISIFRDPQNALKRKRITQVLPTGIRAIDAVSTLGRGQRIGIFSGSGVGKSTLIGMVARNTSADVNVIALLGERGREVLEFIENDLGEEGLSRSVVVAATSDDSPLAKVRGAFVATTIAEYFRDQGKDVMLMMDSVTRFARAQREIGLAIGEPPATGGFTPSVFALMPKILERAGSTDKGTITGIYSILVEGDDVNDPIADSVRGILDGHVVLSRSMAELNHYPAVDVLNSLSRLMNQIVGQEHKDLAAKIREILAVYREKSDLISVGAYVRGADPRTDYAIEMIGRVNEFLRQGIYEQAGFEDTVGKLHDIFSSNEKSGKADNKNESIGKDIDLDDLMQRIDEAV